MTNPESLEVLKVILTVLGGVVAAVITSRLTRASQRESSQIVLLTNLIDQVQEERDQAKEDAKQVPLWRRYAHKLRNQILKLGGIPEEPSDKLEL